MSDQILIDALNKVIKTQEELIEVLKKEVQRLSSSSSTSLFIPHLSPGTPGWLGGPVPCDQPFPNGYPGIIPGISPLTNPIEPGNPYYSTSGYIKTVDDLAK